MIAYKLIIGTDNIYVILLFEIYLGDIIFYLNVKSNNVKILVLCIIK